MMTTERAAQSHSVPDERPSERNIPVPPVGSDAAALLANLNDVYGEPDPADEAVLSGIRQSMRTVLAHER